MEKKRIQLHKYNSYRFTPLTFEAANQTPRYKRKRHISYIPNQLHKLAAPVRSDVETNFTFHLFIYYFSGVVRGAARHVPTMPNVVETGRRQANKYTYFSLMFALTVTRQY
jgi:hypothetical protein